MKNNDGINWGDDNNQMGVKKDTSVNSSAGVNKSNKSNTRVNSSAGDSFSMIGPSGLAPTGSSTSIQKIEETITNKLSSIKSNYTMELLTLSREKDQSLPYSMIIVIARLDVVRYLPIIIEETSAFKPKSVGYLKSELDKTQNFNYKPDIKLTTDTVSANLYKYIEKYLKSNDINGNYAPADAIIAPVGSSEQVYSDIATDAFNIIYVTEQLSKGKKDITLVDNVGQFGKMRYQTSINTEPAEINKLEQAVRSDFTIALEATSPNSSLIEDMPITINVARTTGFIDVLPYKVRENTYNGMPVEKTKFRPHIVITQAQGGLPTINYALLSIATSSLMANPNMYIGALSKRPNIGSLNYLTNVENSQDNNGYGDPGILNNTSANERIELIRKMFVDMPIISIDVALYGTEPYLNLLVSAASPNNPNRQKAAKKIVDSCHHLTGGYFPKDFNLNEIFETLPVVVPTGTYINKESKEVDIRDIDSLYMIHGGDINKAVNWMRSSIIDDSNTSFTNKVNILNDISRDLVIDRKVVRLTFNNKFLSTLSRSCIAAGLDPEYTQLMEFNDNNTNIDMFNKIGGGSLDSTMGTQSFAGSAGPTGLGDFFLN